MVPIPVSLNREVTSNLNDNYLLCPTPSTSVIAKLDNRTLEKTVNSAVIDSPCSKTFHQTPGLPSQNVSYLAVDHAHSVCFQGQPQKKGLSPCIPKRKIKDVKGVFCASQCLFVPHVPNVPNVVPSLAVGGRLQKFWQVWLSLGANPRVVSILQEGYTLPFKIRPPLTRSPVIKSGYAHPGKSKALYQAVTDLVNKLVVEKVVIRSSLAFYNRLFLVPKSNQRWRPILDLSHLNLFLKPGTFKMETPETIRLSLQKGEWVTSLDFSDAYFHIPISQRSRKYLRFFLGKKAFQFTALPFGLATAPLEFTKVVKEVKLMAQARGIRIHQYLDDWLVRAPDQETCQSHTQTLLALCRELGWVVNMEKSELTPQQVFNFVGYRFDLLSGRVLPTQDRWITLQQKLRFIKGRDLFSPSVHVPNRATYCHGKTSMGRPASHETGSVASKKTLACAGEPGEDYSGSPFSSPTPGLVVGRDQCAKRATLASSSARPTDFYRRLKRRLGRTLRGIHSKRRLVRTRKSPPHQFLGTQSSSSGSQEFREAVQGTDCSHSNRQHDCNVIHQQRGRYEIRVSLCPTLEAPILVSSQEDNSAGQTHSGSLECRSRQAVPAQSGDPDRVVPVSTGVQSLVLQLGPASDRSFCHPIQSQASQVCLSSSGLDSLGGGCSQPTMEQPGRVRFSSSLPAQSGHIQTGESGLSQNDLNRSGLAQHALVLGPDQSLKSNSLQSSLGEDPVDSTVQRPSPQELESSESACLAPRASSIRRQGFSEEVAARIEAPQRSSTRAVYKSKWAIFVKWCDSNQVDFRAPSLKQVADFLLYLFKERQLQPSTIEGYRTAIADMVGNDPVHFGKDESLTRLLDSFHRDKPKGRRGVPAWNLSLVLHQLTKAPFEPMRKASLKHLTFKTVFLLALGSGKRRSEIHAWLYRNIRHQENWSQVSLYPSPSFLSKNQLARDGPSAVAPVVIPALAPSLDRSLKEDKSLCPVRALRYYLDRTKDLRSGKDLVFVSFRKSFQKDIVPATVSSWIKQTVLLCYQLSDHEAQTIHQVRAHDVRAFAASKAFQGGVSLDQILSACHWKAHNTFTQFYLKDLAWADSELYHLGPVVAAQQIHEHQ